MIEVPASPDECAARAGQLDRVRLIEDGWRRVRGGLAAGR